MKYLRVPQRHLRGYGLGGIFSSLGRWVRPLLKTAVKAAKPLAKRTLKTLGKEGVKFAGNVIADSLQPNTSLKTALKRNVARTIPKAKAGVKRAFSETTRKSIKGQRGGSKFKRAKLSSVKRKGKKKKRKPYRGIFQ